MPTPPRPPPLFSSGLACAARTARQRTWRTASHGTTLNCVSLEWGHDPAADGITCRHGASNPSPPPPPPAPFSHSNATSKPHHRVPRVRSDALVFEMQEVHVLCQGSGLGHDGLWGIVCPLASGILHVSFRMSPAQRSPRRQPPCPSNTGRWCRHFLFIHPFGGGAVLAYDARCNHPPAAPGSRPPPSATPPPPSVLLNNSAFSGRGGCLTHPPPPPPEKMKFTKRHIDLGYFCKPRRQNVYPGVQILTGCSIGPGGDRFWGGERFWVVTCCMLFFACHSVVYLRSLPDYKFVPDEHRQDVCVTGADGAGAESSAAVARTSASVGNVKKRTTIDSFFK